MSRGVAGILDKRVDGLENDIKDLTRAVGGLESDMRNVAITLKTINDSVVSLTNKLSTESKTNWNVLAAWATFIVAVMSIIGNLALTPMRTKDVEFVESRRRIYNRIHSLEKMHYEHLASQGHLGLSVKINSLSEEVKNINEEQKRRTDKVYKK